MSAYKRKLSAGEKWFFSGSYLAEKYHSKCIYPTKQSALKAERERKKEIEANQINPQKDIGMKELCNLRLDYIESRNSIVYYKDNKRYFKKALDEWGDIQASKVSKKMVLELVDKESKRLRKAEKTLHKANALIRSLKALFNFGINYLDLNIRNPVNGIKMLPVDNVIKYIPTNDDLRILKKICNPEEWELILFLEKTGARIGEAINLKYEDFRGEQIILWTRKAKNSNLTPRFIPKPISLKKSGKGKVFKWKTYPKFLENKVEWGFHNLRHRRATIWASEGKNIWEIMLLLGHSNISTTMGYLKSLGIVLSWNKG